MGRTKRFATVSKKKKESLKVNKSKALASLANKKRSNEPPKVPMMMPSTLARNDDASVAGVLDQVVPPATLQTTLKSAKEKVKKDEEEVQLYKQVIEVLLPGETIQRAIQRYGKDCPKVKKGIKRKVESENNSTTDDNKTKSAKENIMKLTSIADQFLHSGNMDIYERRFEEFQLHLNHSKAPTPEPSIEDDMFSDAFDPTKAPKSQIALLLPVAEPMMMSDVAYSQSAIDSLPPNSVETPVTEILITDLKTEDVNSPNESFESSGLNNLTMVTDTNQQTNHESSNFVSNAGGQLSSTTQTHTLFYKINCFYLLIRLVLVIFAKMLS